jgi:serine/threonine-protein kinase
VRIAREATADDEKGQIIGTFFYMSPEQAHARIDMIDERTDVFLLGGVLYEILTGQPPYMGNTVVDVVRSAQQCKVPQPELVAPERNIPTALTRIVMKCLAKEQRDRYQNALSLKDDVELFLKGGMSFPTLTFRAGEHLMKEGEKGDQVFILKKGLVQVYKTYEDGRRHGLATLGPGAVVGEAAVLSAGERTASVVAVEDVLATAVTRTQLEKELGLNSWMGSLVKALADRFLGVDDNLDTARGELAFLKIEHWIFEYLLAHGKPSATGQREVELAKMVRHARRELKKSEAEIQRVIDGAPKIRTDVARDACWYQGL